MPYKDPERQRKAQREWMARRKAQWIEENGPCASCGSSEDLQVDHIDPSKKISHACWSWSEQRRLAELAKCQVLCAPCHLRKSLRERAKGEAHGRALLTDKKVKKIRKKYQSGQWTHLALAQKYGVGQTTIRNIIHRRTWRHI